MRQNHGRFCIIKIKRGQKFGLLKPLLTFSEGVRRNIAGEEDSMEGMVIIHRRAAKDAERVLLYIPAEWQKYTNCPFPSLLGDGLMDLNESSSTIIGSATEVHKLEYEQEP